MKEEGIAPGENRGFLIIRGGGLGEYEFDWTTITQKLAIGLHISMRKT